ncbi:hypothetical protein EVAR_40491_1 [Eumeta japonica]|uniref:Uncharacterized protein n=1 Tax=Eumeta variegata TaxID=151549 RepID=A0A4C1XX40_EUMVA|nr:hypothetical protein EVAR_40491_1 [Eumeta japonica]
MSRCWRDVLSVAQTQAPTPRYTTWHRNTTDPQKDNRAVSLVRRCPGSSHRLIPAPALAAGCGRPANERTNGTRATLFGALWMKRTFCASLFYAYAQNNCNDEDN